MSPVHDIFEGLTIAAVGLLLNGVFCYSLWSSKRIPAASIDLKQIGCACGSVGLTILIAFCGFLITVRMLMNQDAFEHWFAIEFTSPGKVLAIAFCWWLLLSNLLCFFRLPAGVNRSEES